MCENIKKIKFETLICDINDDMDYLGGVNNCKAALSLIFDYDKLNSYGKAIMDGAYISFSNNMFSVIRLDCEWEYTYDNIMALGSLREKIDVTKAFIKTCRDEKIIFRAHLFIFWALMILAVDRNGSEENLSAICDFASMMNIREDEIMGIVKIIKIVIREEIDEEFDTEELYINELQEEIVTMNGLVKFCDLLESYK